MESDFVTGTMGNGTLVQLKSDMELVKKYSHGVNYIHSSQWQFFEEERPAMIIDSYKQGQTVYYKLMLVYTGEVLGGVPAQLLQPNKLVL